MTLLENGLEDSALVWSLKMIILLFSINSTLYFPRGGQCSILDLYSHDFYIQQCFQALQSFSICMTLSTSRPPHFVSKAEVPMDWQSLKGGTRGQE